MDNADKKPPKIKILQLTQQNFATIGISPNLVLQSYPINVKIFLGLFTSNSYIICSMIYLIYTANSITENTQIIFMSLVAAVIVLLLFALIVNAGGLFKYINDCEDIVNTSEYGQLNLPFVETR